MKSRKDFEIISIISSDGMFTLQLSNNLFKIHADQPYGRGVSGSRRPLSTYVIYFISLFD